MAVDKETGEVASELVVASDDTMLRHFGIEGEGNRVWRTVTPAALPLRAARRRIDPDRLSREIEAARKAASAPAMEAKTAHERLEEEGRAIAALAQALRHAGASSRTEMIRVQREPFEGKGERAEAFAGGTRFAKERLWHAEITFAEPFAGPLVIGNGRYLGLDTMAPAEISGATPWSSRCRRRQKSRRPIVRRS